MSHRADQLKSFLEVAASKAARWIVLSNILWASAAAPLAPPTTLPKAPTFEAALTQLRDVAAQNGMTIKSSTDDGKDLKIVMDASTARINKFLSTLDQSLNPSHVSINVPKPGQDDLEVSLTIPLVTPQKERRGETLNCLRDLTPNFPVGPNTAWVTALSGTTATGQWRLTVTTTTEEIAKKLHADIAADPKFADAKVASLMKEAKTGNLIMTLSVTHKESATK